MKKTIITLLLTLFLTTPAIANELPKQVLSANPLGLVFGIMNLEYERTIDQKSTWSVRGLYWGADDEGWEWTAFGLGGSYRRYFASNAPKGGYWGAGIDSLSISADYVDESGSSVFFIPKVEIGYQWLLGNTVAINLGGDVRYVIGTLDIAGEKFPVSGFGIGLKLALGYAW